MKQADIIDTLINYCEGVFDDRSVTAFFNCNQAIIGKFKQPERLKIVEQAQKQLIKTQLLKSIQHEKSIRLLKGTSSRKI
jgi:hypothetical protein